jgi:hypothetical protein
MCINWYSTPRTLSGKGGHRLAGMVARVRAFALKPRALGAPLRLWGLTAQRDRANRAVKPTRPHCDAVRSETNVSSDIVTSRLGFRKLWRGRSSERRSASFRSRSYRSFDSHRRYEVQRRL